MKHVLITGGTKGIGLAITKMFVDAGARVTVIARSFDSFELRSHPHVHCIAFDLAQIESIPGVVAKIGDVDILINNAGILNGNSYDVYPEDKKNLLLKLNLEAPVALIQQISPGMIKKNYGRIVNIASVAGQIGHPDIWYGISKAGVINFTKSFARIFGPKGISVNCVAPGPVEDTEMFGIIQPARKEQIKQSAVSGKFAMTDDVAKTVYWLAADAPGYITGICIDINNGSFMR